MITLSKDYAHELYDKACNRTVKMGAESLEDTISLLEHEINQYREKIQKLNEKIEVLNHDKEIIKHRLNGVYGIGGIHAMTSDTGKTVITINRTDVDCVEVRFKEGE